MRVWCWLLVLPWVAWAEEEPQCACQPTVYTFTFNASALCIDQNVAGPGIAQDDCSIIPLGDTSITDLVPVTFTDVEVLELGQAFNVIAQTPVSGTFVDGESFTYNSVLDLDLDVDNAIDLPRALQVNILAVNVGGGQLRNSWLILFTNDCDNAPVLFAGQKAGWTILVRVTECVDGWKGARLTL